MQRQLAQHRGAATEAWDRAANAFTVTVATSPKTKSKLPAQSRKSKVKALYQEQGAEACGRPRIRAGHLLGIDLGAACRH
jgi:hypothetical protein